MYSCVCLAWDLSILFILLIYFLFYFGGEGKIKLNSTFRRDSKYQFYYYYFFYFKQEMICRLPVFYPPYVWSHVAFVCITVWSFSWFLWTFRKYGLVSFRKTPPPSPGRYSFIKTLSLEVIVITSVHKNFSFSFPLFILITFLDCTVSSKCC